MSTTISPGIDARLKNRPLDRQTGERLALNGRVLGLLNIYRILVPLVLVSLYSLGGGRGIAVDSPRLFFSAAGFYLGFGLVSAFLVRQRLGGAYRQTILQATLDLLVLMLLLHACGGMAGGMGLLLLVPVGSLAFLLPPRSALFLAAITIIALLTHTIWLQMTGRVDINVYATTGLLGIVLFTIAAAASSVATRIQQSDELVRQRDVDLANLAELSQYIVQHLRESLLVVDAADTIRLINESAAAILGDEHAIPGALVGEVAPRLLYSLATWRSNNRADEEPSSFVAADGARMIQPHFAPLGGIDPGPTLIFLEDTSLMAERVQQSKLAALGRLSASIAHEIRNPVGAMSHAGQLLAESPVMGVDERHLTDIIRSNSERVSTIINNVLQLSRREATKPSRLTLGDWLEDFLEEFCETMRVTTTQIAVLEEAPNLEVLIDPTHLHQAVWNLCDNALKYGEARDGISIEIKIGRLNPSSRPFLEVVNTGSIIETSAIDRIFEPFYTGQKGGTGLGLFIARELCQLNRAVLLYAPRGLDGNTFRVVFSDPQRWEEYTTVGGIG
jgi:two-component system sensor histidine kinase PilS (NtrC family)